MQKRNKRVLITGASGGIGCAIAERFSREGYEVLLHANRNAERARILAEKLGNASVYEADFSVDGEAERLAKEVGAVDVLVNNAGIAHSALFQDVSDEELDVLFSVNLKSAMRLSRALLPDMIRNRCGSIVNVSSVWGQTGASMEVCYSASKAGLIGFTKALAKEVAPSCVRVNCVCPGVIDTEMMAVYSEKEKAALCEEIPLSRLGLALEVANAVYFLASEEASYITGDVLSVNGGMYV